MFSITQLLKFVIPKKKHHPLAIDIRLQAQLIFKNIISESSCGSLLRTEHKVWYFQKMISSALPRKHIFTDICIIRRQSVRWISVLLYTNQKNMTCSYKQVRYVHLHVAYHVRKSSVAGAQAPVSLSTCCFMTMKFPYNDKAVWLTKTRSPFPGEMVLVLKLHHVFWMVSMKTMTNWVPKKLSKSKSKPPDCVIKYLYTWKILLSLERWGLNYAFLFYWNYRYCVYVLLHSISKYLHHHVIQILCLLIKFDDFTTHLFCSVVLQE